MDSSSSTAPELVVVCCSLAWGGLEKIALEDAQALSQAGFRVRMLLTQGSPIAERASALSSECFSTVIFPRLPRNTLDFSFGRVLRRTVGVGTKAVWIHQPSLLGSVVPALIGIGARILVTRHIRSNHRKFTPWHRFLYASVSKMIVLSQAMRENVIETHPIPPEKIAVIPPALDPARFEIVPERVQRYRKSWNAQNPATRVFGIAGRLDPLKGQKEFLEAAAIFTREHPGIDARWIVIGEETRGGISGYAESLRAFARESGLEGKAFFPGYVSDLPQALRALDIFVLPSRDEAFGLVAIEALAMGRPVVMLDSGSAREIIANEKWGELIPDHSPATIARALSEVGAGSKYDDMRQSTLQYFGRESWLKQMQTLVG